MVFGIWLGRIYRAKIFHSHSEESPSRYTEDRKSSSLQISIGAGMGCGCGKQQKIGVMGQIKNVTHAFVSVASGHSFKVDDDTYINRINRCKQCDKLNKSSMRCNICGCFIQVKAKYKGASFECPEGKWQ